MNANEAKSSGPALRELAGLLPDFGEFYRDVAPVLHPTLQTGVESLVVASRAWLPGQLAHQR